MTTAEVFHVPWCTFWGRLGASGEPDEVFALLMRCYAHPGRYYHTLEHIECCLTELQTALEHAEQTTIRTGDDKLRYTARERDVIEAAIWFHDAINIPGLTVNEVVSAALMQH